MRVAIETSELYIRRSNARGCFVFVLMIEWIEIYSEVRWGTQPSLNLKLKAK